MNDHHLTLPDLGFDDQPVVVSMWLVKEGAAITEGEPLIEVLAGPVAVDLPAPVEGVLTKKLVADGETLTLGQQLAIIES
jgi:pyruvate/2-oxoglutarate dehydrogenase complex dihydrolipoamide acyltransferase (E2) component